MEVEGKPPPADYGGGTGKGLDLRGDSAHHTDVESDAYAQVPCRRQGLCEVRQALVDSSTLCPWFSTRVALFLKTRFCCARDDREEYDDDGHVARRGNFVRAQLPA